MEIRVIPSRLKSHASYFEDEIRVLRSLEEMAELTYISNSGKSAVMQSIRKLNESVKMRNEIFENLEQMLKEQEIRIQEHVDSLKESQRR